MIKKAAVFCSRGLGDGLLFLIVSNNLKNNGYQVDTFHNSLFQIENYFPGLPIKEYPQEQEIEQLLRQYDLIIINSDSSLINQHILKYSKMNFPQKTWELHPSTCKGHGKIIGDYKFNIKKSMAENLKIFCSTNLQLSNAAKSNGIVYNDKLVNRKFLNRIIIHPESSQNSRNWPKRKFLNLSKKLINKGFEPVFIIPVELVGDWKGVNNVKIFDSLEALTEFIFESGYLIGNDSGLGHLASNLNIPTLTIFSEKRKSTFWFPNWAQNVAISPRNLPNFKGMRLRDKYWKIFITVFRVYKKFKKIIPE